MRPRAGYMCISGRRCSGAQSRCSGTGRSRKYGPPRVSAASSLWVAATQLHSKRGRIASEVTLLFTLQEGEAAFELIFFLFLLFFFFSFFFWPPRTGQDARVPVCSSAAGAGAAVPAKPGNLHRVASAKPRHARLIVQTWEVQEHVPMRCHVGPRIATRSPAPWQTCCVDRRRPWPTRRRRRRGRQPVSNGGHRPGRSATRAPGVSRSGGTTQRTLFGGPCCNSRSL